MISDADAEIKQAASEDARELEVDSHATGPYPAGTRISRPNRPTRMFNLRLTEDQFKDLEDAADRRHLPVSTMARAWLLERLDEERTSS